MTATTAHTKNLTLPTDEFGPRYWEITAVNNSLAHPVTVIPYAMACADPG
jgi:hypothetical protein